MNNLTDDATHLNNIVRKYVYYSLFLVSFRLAMKKKIAKKNGRNNANENKTKIGNEENTNNNNSDGHN